MAAVFRVGPMRRSSERQIVAVAASWREYVAKKKRHRMARCRPENSGSLLLNALALLLGREFRFLARVVGRQLAHRGFGPLGSRMNVALRS